MGARDYPGATCGRLVVMRMKVDKKKEWDKGKTLHSKETKKKRGKKRKCSEERR